MHANGIIFFQLHPTPFLRAFPGPAGKSHSPLIWYMYLKYKCLVSQWQEPYGTLTERGMEVREDGQMTEGIWLQEGDEFLFFSLDFGVIFHPY